MEHDNINRFLCVHLRITLSAESSFWSSMPTIFNGQRTFYSIIYIYIYIYIYILFHLNLFRFTILCCLPNDVLLHKKTNVWYKSHETGSITGLCSQFFNAPLHGYMNGVVQQRWVLCSSVYYKFLLFLIDIKI